MKIDLTEEDMRTIEFALTERASSIARSEHAPFLEKAAMREAEECLRIADMLSAARTPVTSDRYEVFPCADESDRWAILDVSKANPVQVGNLWCNERNARDACAGLNQKARQQATDVARRTK